MGVTVVLKTYQNGQMSYNSYKMLTTDDVGRESAGMMGNLIVGGIGGLLGGTLGSGFGPGGSVAGAIAGDYYGGNLGEDIGKAIYDSLQAQYDEMSEAEKQAWRDKGFIPYDPIDPNNHSPFPINPDVNDNYKRGKNWVAPRRDPLVLDLDGDGIETLGVNATTHVVFDYDGDGVKTGTGWIKGDDGFVVLDRNGNGTIDNGGELFGDQTLVNGAKASDGFAALSAEDTNHNGKFDAGDTNFTNVRIWQDTNSDGISQAGELHTLSELGITSINLTSTTSNTVSNGNVQIAAGTYTKTNGDTGESATLNLTEDTGNAGNLNFSQNPFYSEFTDHLTLTDTALALPDMQGSGMVRDLREASTLSTSLTATLQNMKDTYETRDQMMAQIDTLLAEWAGTSSMETGRMLANTMGGDLAYVEAGDQALYHKYLWATQHNDFSIMTADEILAAQAIVDKQNRLAEMVDVLERFNAEVFSGTILMFKDFVDNGQLVQVNTGMVLEGHANTSEWTFTDPMEVSLSSTQIDSLEQ
ncbi:MAG: hypothetical protein PHE23_13230, partial [Sulfuricurvum sp.]|nr:hypothetical protein [Sulfuricurvum sp.]